MSDLIERQAALDAVCEHGTNLERRGITVLSVANHKQVTVDLLETLPSAQTWIPVTERLPEDGVFVLTCNDEGKIIVAKYESEVPEWEFKYCNYDWDVWDDEEHGVITAWMPLPEPYREDDHDAEE